MTINSRAKGHTFERETSHQFQEMGWKGAQTTRAARGGDWSHTDDGIDLTGTEPFAVQCKRLANYVPVNTIEEIGLKPGFAFVPVDPYPKIHQGQPVFSDGPAMSIPLLLTKADHKPTMAILPWSELQKLLKANYSSYKHTS